MNFMTSPIESTWRGDVDDLRRVLTETYGVPDWIVDRRGSQIMLDEALSAADYAACEVAYNEGEDEGYKAGRRDGIVAGKETLLESGRDVIIDSLVEEGICTRDEAVRAAIVVIDNLKEVSV